MADFPGLPVDIYEYVNTFNYSAWGADTELYFCDVPWDSEYRDVVKFGTEAARDTWFAGTTGYKARLTTKRIVKPMQGVTVNIPFGQCCNFNYLVVTHPVAPVDASWSLPVKRKYYYFVTDCEYLTPNATLVNLQLDVWMTYQFDVTFGVGYLVRGHYSRFRLGEGQSLALINNWRCDGRSNVYNRERYLLDEGLDYGGRYVEVRNAIVPLSGTFSNPYPMIYFTSSYPLGISSYGTVNNPVNGTSYGDVISGAPSGCWVYAIAQENWYAFTAYFAAYPWVANCLQVLTCDYGASSVLVENTAVTSKVGFTVYTVANQSVGQREISLQLNAPGVPPVTSNPLCIGTRNPYDLLSFKKFMFPPYCHLRITNGTGNSLVLDPCYMFYWMSGENEQIDSGFGFRLYSITTPPYMSRWLIPYVYNRAMKMQLTAASSNTVSTRGFFYTLSIPEEPGYGSTDYILPTDDGYPTFATYSSGYLNQMAATAGSRQYAYDAAQRNYTLAQSSAATAYNQASAAIEANLAQTRIGNAAALRQTQIANSAAMQQARTSLPSSMAYSASEAAGGIPVLGDIANAWRGLSEGYNRVVNGGAQTIANQQTQNAANMMQTAAQNAANLASTRIANQQAAYNRDTNYALAMASARADYANSIGAINAQMRDAQATPPSQSGCAGGAAMQWATGYTFYRAVLERIEETYIETIAAFWYRYGYVWRDYVTPPSTLQCMSRFTYWQFEDLHIRAAYVPETFKNAIRGIFETGVTVWNNPSDIGYLNTNDVLGAIA